MSRFQQIQGAFLGPVGRASLLVLFTFLLTVFCLARSMEPDPRGYGTHRQLGLPECTFQMLFSIPCPGCGMTTSFSHFVRGDLWDAARVSISGLLLAIVATVVIPWSLASAVRGRLLGIKDPSIVCARLVITLGGISLVNWLCRLWSSTL